MNRKQKRQYDKAQRRAQKRRADGYTDQTVETCLAQELQEGCYYPVPWSVEQDKEQASD